MTASLPRPQAVIFDLDGTLWDTCPAVAVAWNTVLARHGIAFREIAAEDVRGVTGRPHAECIETVFAGLPRAQIALLVEETMEEDNRAIARLGGELYPGVREGLPWLAERYPLHIVSNCQAGYIEVFLEWSGLGACFTDFECWGNTGNSKGDNLRTVVARNGLDGGGNPPLYIGDTDGDRQAARDAALPFLQVTYGFGPPLPGERQAHSFRALLDLLT